MKRLFFALFLLWAAPAWCGGSCTDPTILTPVGDGVFKVLVTCTADASDASLSDTIPNATAAMGGLYLYQIVSYPGGTAPTDASELEITDSNGMSILGANGTDFIDATSTLRTLPYSTHKSLNDYPVVDGALTLTIAVTNNAVNSAITNLIFYLVKN